MEKNFNLVRTVYTYTVCTITMVAFLIGAISALNISVKYYVFDLRTPQYEQAPATVCNNAYEYPTKTTNDMGQLVEPITAEEKAACIERVTQSQLEMGKKEALSNLSWALAAMLVSFPLWLYHWRFVRK